MWRIKGLNCHFMKPWLWYQHEKRCYPLPHITEIPHTEVLAQHNVAVVTVETYCVLCKMSDWSTWDLGLPPWMSCSSSSSPFQWGKTIKTEKTVALVCNIADVQGISGQQWYQSWSGHYTRYNIWDLRYFSSGNKILCRILRFPGPTLEGDNTAHMGEGRNKHFFVFIQVIIGANTFSSHCCCGFLFTLRMVARKCVKCMHLTESVETDYWV